MGCERLPIFFDSDLKRSISYGVYFSKKQSNNASACGGNRRFELRDRVFTE
jgi:hypothetical protein